MGVFYNAFVTIAPVHQKRQSARQYL
jgi:hypothetical protein